MAHEKEDGEQVRDTPMSTPCWHELASPVGTLRLTHDGRALIGIRFRAGAALLTEPRHPAVDSACGADPGVFAVVIRQLQEYFGGERRSFELPLAPRGSAFQQQVWRELQRIPYGETISYGELARRIGRPRACRAVGLANGANPLPIVVPCHRVIGADGSLTGFGGGLPIKRQLLDLERLALMRQCLHGRAAGPDAANGSVMQLPLENPL